VIVNDYLLTAAADGWRVRDRAGGLPMTSATDFSKRTVTPSKRETLAPKRELIRGWPLEAIALHLEAITFGDIKRLLINVPPGFMKSLMLNVFWPAWEWGPMNMPYLTHLAFAYAQDLTTRDNNKLVKLVTSPQYPALWGDRFTMVKIGEHRPENDQTGFVLATSTDGVSTGERGDRIRLDDPHNVVKIESDHVMEKTVRFFRESMSNGLNDEDSAIVVCMQRVKDTDASGESWRARPTTVTS
jgi:hypothetical protein